jgi:RNase P protein component
MAFPADVVVRALPGSALIDWNTLVEEFNEAWTKASDRANQA